MWFPDDQPMIVLSIVITLISHSSVMSDWGGKEPRGDTPRGCPKSRRRSRRKDFCLGARSRARSIAPVLRDERATPPQGKNTSAQRVTANLGRDLRCSLLTDHRGYARRSRLDSAQIRLVTRPTPTFRTASSRKMGAPGLVVAKW